MANKIKYATLLLSALTTLGVHSANLDFGEKVPRICWIKVEKANSKETDVKHEKITIKPDKLPDGKNEHISCNYLD